MKSSLRRRFFKILFYVTILPIILLGLLLIYQSFRVQANAAIDSQYQIASQVSILAQDLLNEPEQSAMFIANTNDLFSRQPGELKLLLSKLITFDDSLEEIVLIDSKGNEVTRVSRARFSPDNELNNWARRPEFIFPFEGNVTHFSPIRISDINNKPLMDISLPIQDAFSGKPKGVILVTVSLNNIWSLVREKSFDLNQEIYIISGNGLVVAHANPSIILRHTNFIPENGSGIGRGISDSLVVYGTATFKVGDQEFIVIAEKPVQDAFYSSIVSVFTVIAIVLVVTFLSIFLIRITGDRLVMPILTLAEMAKAIQQGDFTKRSNIEGDDEIGLLSNSLNQMADDLQVTFTSIAESNAALSEIKDNLQKQNLALTALQEATLYIVSEINLDKVLQAIITQAALLVQSTNGFLFLVDKDGEHLVLEVGVGINAEFVGKKIKRGEGVAGVVWDTGTPLVVKNYSQWENRVELFEKARLYAVAGVPMKLGDHVIGVLGVDQTEEGSPITDHEMELLANFGQLAAIAVENARLYRQAQDEIRERSRIETALQQAEAQYRTLVEKTPAIIYIDSITEFWHTDYISPQVETILGIKPEVWVDKNLQLWNEIIHPEDRFYTVQSFEQFFKHGVNIDVEYRVIRPDNGKIIWIRDQAVMLFDNNGNRSAIQGVMIDITDKKTAEEQTQKQVQRLNVLRTIDISIASNTNIAVTLQVVAKQATSQSGVDDVKIALFNSKLNMLDYSSGNMDKQGAKSLFRLRETPAENVIMNYKSIHINNFQVLQSQYPAFFNFIGETYTSYYGIPLITKGRLNGVMEVFQSSSTELDDDLVEFLETLAGQAGIAIENHQLFDNLQRSNMDLVRAYETTLEGWSAALDLRDKETEGHTQRVTNLTLRLAKIMNVSDGELANIKRGALLHDIGKMGVPDRILQKPSGLDEEEKQLMQQHPIYAYNLLNQINYLRPALDIPYSHHEKWDGTGYPQGLKGEKIPFAARLFSVVDVYDALTSDRPYRAGWTQEKTINYIKNERGKHFDPNVVDAFIKMIEEEIASNDS
jgi:PAS domain S-box-containing protein/putative nucleotidyltransferase with HDIG domain